MTSRVNPTVRHTLTFSNRKSKYLCASAALLLALAAAGCFPAPASLHTPNSLAPRGPAAAGIAGLGWLMFALGAAVFVIVTALLLYSVATRRGGDLERRGRRGAPGDSAWIWWGGIILPAIILAVTLVFSLRELRALASPAVQPDIVIQVTGYQWWWEVRYPEHDFATGNELHIPVGQPVEIRLTAADVIHSFWVPELAGKLDLLPGRTTTLWIQADEPGEYRGICAEFCGRQHAKMHFIVVAEDEQDYAAWVETQRQPAAEPGDEALRRGQQVFLGSSCVYCHTVRGTNASALVGPDLTHVAGRRTLGAGLLRNNRGTLAGWIVDPQHLKPGNKMPATNLSGADLQALLDYLESLE